MEVKRVWLAFGGGAALGLWLYVSVFRPSMDLPHCIPRFPGGLAFRFGLARDVLHERYPIVTKAECENSIKDYNPQDLSALPIEGPALGNRAYPE